MNVLAQLLMWIAYWAAVNIIFGEIPKNDPRFWFLLSAPIVIHYLLNAITIL